MMHHVPQQPRHANPTPSPDRERRVCDVVYQYLTRLDRGEAPSAEDLIAEHPDLMPELASALTRGERQLRHVADAERAAGGSGVHADLAAGRPAEPRPDLSPTWQDRPAVRGYRLVREISGGGQGTVFEGVQLATGRTVAVKVLTAASAGSTARFERESQTLAVLNHPGIVGIVDRGRTTTGGYYLAMEYVAGQDLDEWVAQRRGESPGHPRAVLTLFARIAAALDAAHRQGVVHRDLKPSNVRVDPYGNPRIVDFGLARLAAAPPTGRDLTLTGNIIGSVPWASPEQAAGEAARLGPPSDVYSLGLLLYHALTGRFPYGVRGPLHVVTRNICCCPPADPRRAGDPASGFGPIDAPLAQVLLRCLRKEPADRFASGGDLAAAIERYLAGEPPAATAGNRRRAWGHVTVAASATLTAVTAAWITAPGPRDDGRPAADTRVSPAALPSRSGGPHMKFVLVPAGRFRMGSAHDESGRRDDEDPHVVRLSRPLWVSRTEVTRSQFRAVMGRLPPGLEGEPEAATDLPVDRVTWQEAQTFCQRLSALDGFGYRLPTEAEWEYACRAGTQGAYGGTGDVRRVGWIGAAGVPGSGAPAHRAGTLEPNHWGIFDMHGNVAEWTADRYVPHLGSEPRVDPAHTTGDASFVVRGGSSGDAAGDCRSASRASRPAASRQPGVGFRVVADAGPPPPSSPTTPTRR